MRLLSVLFVLALAIFPLELRAQDVGTVTFAFDSATLDEAAQAKVAEIAEKLKENADYRATVVVGHTDAVGSNAYNQGLGMRRAQTVATALKTAGAPVSRIGTVESRGENELLVRVTGPERKNRRVTVTLEQILDACRSWCGSEQMALSFSRPRMVWCGTIIWSPSEGGGPQAHDIQVISPPSPLVCRKRL